MNGYVFQTLRGKAHFVNEVEWLDNSNTPAPGPYLAKAVLRGWCGSSDYLYGRAVWFRSPDAPTVTCKRCRQRLRDMRDVIDLRLGDER